MTLRYSIIIPHKNCPDLLQRCIDSIPERDDIEIVVVDDNSDPLIVDFSLFPGIRRKNVYLFFTKEGKGAGYARNYGLKKSKGKWILFADSDDFYEHETFDILDNYTSGQVDVIYYTVSTRNSDTLELSSARRVVSNESVLNYKIDDYKSTLLLKYRNSAPWNKVIRRDIIETHNLSFDETKMNNDIFFSLYLGKAVNNYLVIKKGLYCFTFRENSITTMKRKVEDENLLLLTRIRVNQFYKSIKCQELRRPYLGTFFIIYKRNGLIYFIRYLLFLIRNISMLINVKNHWEKPIYK